MLHVNVPRYFGRAGAVWALIRTDELIPKLGVEGDSCIDRSAGVPAEPPPPQFGREQTRIELITSQSLFISGFPAALHIEADNRNNLPQGGVAVCDS
jgi:hypothetical protein